MGRGTVHLIAWTCDRFLARQWGSRTSPRPPWRKYTPERADILDAIIERDGVFEVEELLLEMRRRGHRVSKATIYRTIKLLQDAGIITQALFDSRQSHYRLIYGRAPRDYLVCMKTGRHVEFTNRDLIQLRDRICQEHGWEPVGHRFQIYGISPEGRALGEDDEEGTEGPGDQAISSSEAGRLLR
jgi:Fur family ferric uptake transcriptional regulator